MNTETTMENVTPADLNALRMRGERVVLIDVSTPAEFHNAHIDGAVNAPIGSTELEALMHMRGELPGAPWYVMCAGGVRSVKVCKQFPSANLVNVEGGLKRWRLEGFPTAGAGKSMSLRRQAQIVYGALVVTGVMAGLYVHPYWFGMVAVVGVGFVYAGATDTCRTAALLARMPWNRPKKPNASVPAVTSFSH